MYKYYYEYESLLLKFDFFAKNHEYYNSSQCRCDLFCTLNSSLEGATMFVPFYSSGDALTHVQ